MAHVGTAYARLEDDRFLTGRGRFVDDIRLAGEAYAAFVRSPHARARFGAIDTARARAMPGVLAVLTGADWRRDGGGDTDVLWDIASHDGTPMATAPRPIFADGEARHVGDTVALVVAEDPHAAAGAAAAVEVVWEPLAAVTDLAATVEPGAPLVHDRFRQQRLLRLAYRRCRCGGGGLRRRVPGHGVAAGQQPSRAERDRVARGPSVRTTGATAATRSGPRPRTRISSASGLRATRCARPSSRSGWWRPMSAAASARRPITTRREASLPWAARLVGRPVRWTATRAETLTVDIHARDHATEARMAFGEDGRIAALEVDTIGNLGAYQSQFAACIPSIFCTTMASGQYAIPAIHCRVRGVYTHTTPVDAYRGAGNPEITYVIERLVENGARERAGDPLAARARNLVPAASMPYASATGVTYDVGDFPAVMDKARRLAGIEALRAEQARLRAGGTLMGIGMAAFVRSGGAGPSRLAAALGARMGLWDVATVRVHPSGKITVLCGSHSHGQSHATTYAQIVADRFGCALADIDVVEGDTDRIPPRPRHLGLALDHRGGECARHGLGPRHRQGPAPRRPPHGMRRGRHRLPLRRLRRARHRPADELRRDRRHGLSRRELPPTASSSGSKRRRSSTRTTSTIPTAPTSRPSPSMPGPARCGSPATIRWKTRAW